MSPTSFRVQLRAAIAPVLAMLVCAPYASAQTITSGAVYSLVSKTSGMALDNGKTEKTCPNKRSRSLRRWHSEKGLRGRITSTITRMRFL
jgi:hypothetical protein